VRPRKVGRLPSKLDLPRMPRLLVPYWPTKHFDADHECMVNNSRQSQPIGRSALASDHPVSLLQCFQDLSPIGVGKRALSVIRTLRHLLGQAQG
jgi:hypothetical protein